MNAAGLTTVIFSVPELVDLTPPEIQWIRDGMETYDIDYQETLVITATWLVLDNETGVVECDWAIGEELGSQNIMVYSSTDTVMSSSVDLEGIITAGQTIYVTVRCKNGARLQSYQSSDGVTIVGKPPDSTNADINAFTYSASQYPHDKMHQANGSTLALGWSNLFGSVHYKIKITDGSTLLDWCEVGAKDEQFVKILDLSNDEHHSTKPRDYNLHLIGINQLGEKSEPITQQIYVGLNEPIFTDEIMYFWPNENTMNLDWSGCFMSTSTLVYEIHIGTEQGSNDILSWYDTTATSMQLKDVSANTKYFVSITGVDKAGQYLTHASLVKYGT